MKTARSVLLVAFVALANIFTLSMVLPFAFLEDTPEFVMTIGFGALVLAFFVSIACIVVAAASFGPLAVRPDQQKGLGLQVFVCKLLMIPYFIATFAFVLMLIFASSLLTISIHLASMGFLLGAMTAVIVPIMSVVNYLFLMATSSFAISNIALAYRKGIISRSSAVIFIILQCLPIADVASYGFIIRHFRTQENAVRQSVPAAPIGYSR